jgi:hypothetical protein
VIIFGLRLSPAEGMRKREWKYLGKEKQLVELFFMMSVVL